MPNPGVPRSLRLVNLLAALLFAAGAGVYLWAWIGMAGLESYVPPPDAEGFAGMARFNHFWELSRVGLWLMAASLLVAVIAAIAVLVVRRRATRRAP